MKKLFTSFISAALVSVSCLAAPVAPRMSAKVENTPKAELRVKQSAVELNNKLTDPAQARTQAKAMAKAKAAAKAAAPRKAAPGPGDIKLIEEFPKPEDVKIAIKEGAYYSYSWWTGMSFGPMEYNISQYEIVGDKMYVGGIFCGSTTNGLVVGDIKDSQVTFTFPQYTCHEVGETYDGGTYTVDEYAVIVEFKPSEDDPESGWYYASDNQTLTFNIGADGKLSLPADAGTDFLIGACEWTTEEYNYDTDEYEPVDEPYWYWTGNGDYITSVTEFTEQPVEAPANLAYEGWVTVNQNNIGTTRQISFDGNDVYIKGLSTSSGCRDYVIKGRMEGDKIIFDTDQYMGPYVANGTLVYMKAAKYAEDGETWVSIPEATFTYDKAKGVISTDDVIVLSGTPERFYYYNYFDGMSLTQPNPAEFAKEVYNPVIDEYYCYFPEGDWSGMISFYYPNVDKAGNELDTKNMYYEVFMDGEPFEVYADEYPDVVPEGQEYITLIPYLTDAYDIYNYGNFYCVFDFFVEGFESMEVQTVYKDGDREVRSDKVKVLALSSVKETVVHGEPVSTRYYDIMGRAIAHPAQGGLYIRQTTYSDGTVKADKFIR